MLGDKDSIKKGNVALGPMANIESGKGSKFQTPRSSVQPASSKGFNINLNQTKNSKDGKFADSKMAVSKRVSFDSGVVAGDSASDQPVLMN